MGCIDEYQVFLRTGLVVVSNTSPDVNHRLRLRLDQKLAFYAMCQQADWQKIGKNVREIFPEMKYFSNYFVNGFS